MGKLETPYHTLQLKFTGMDFDSLLTDNAHVPISKDDVAASHMRQMQQSFHAVTVQDMEQKTVENESEIVPIPLIANPLISSTPEQCHANLGNDMDYEVSRINSKTCDTDVHGNMNPSKEAERTYDRVRHYVYVDTYRHLNIFLTLSRKVEF